jgi:hypothetical protein
MERIWHYSQGDCRVFHLATLLDTGPRQHPTRRNNARLQMNVGRAEIEVHLTTRLPLVT